MDYRLRTNPRDHAAVDSYLCTSPVVWHRVLAEYQQSLLTTNDGRAHSLSHCPSPPLVLGLHLGAVEGELEPGNCHFDL